MASDPVYCLSQFLLIFILSCPISRAPIQFPCHPNTNLYHDLAKLCASVHQLRQFDLCSSCKMLYSGESAGRILTFISQGILHTSTDTQVTKNILHVQALQVLNLHVYYTQPCKFYRCQTLRGLLRRVCVLWRIQFYMCRDSVHKRQGAGDVKQINSSGGSSGFSHGALHSSGLQIQLRSLTGCGEIQIEFIMVI